MQNLSQELQDYLNGICCTATPVATPPTIEYTNTQEDMIAGNPVNICPTTLTGDATITVTVSPSLPAGLSLNPNTGCITGTPTTTSALSSFTFTATNSAGNDTFDIGVLVQQEFPIKVQGEFSSKTAGDVSIAGLLISGTLVGSSFANGLYTFETTAGAEVGDNYTFIDATLYEDSTGLITTYGDNAFQDQNSSSIILGSGLTFGSNAFNSTQNSIVTMGSFTAANDGTFGNVPNDGCTFNFTGTIGSTTGDDGIFSGASNWSSNGAIVNTIIANETSDVGNIEGDLNLLISVGGTVNFTL